MAMIAADAFEAMSQDATIYIFEEDLLRDGTVVSKLALISIRIDIY